jgi:hypothetical protein
LICSGSNLAPFNSITFLDEINEKKLIGNKQIGYIKGCGTELNLLRLKQRINDVKKEKNMFNKYLIFIDLKNAYDKVIHKNYLKN